MSIQTVGRLRSNRLPDALGQCKQTRENLSDLQGSLRSLGRRIIVLVQARVITQLAVKISVHLGSLLNRVSCVNRAREVGSPEKKA